MSSIFRYGTCIFAIHNCNIVFILVNEGGRCRSIHEPCKLTSKEPPDLQNALVCGAHGCSAPPPLYKLTRQTMLTILNCVLFPLTERNIQDTGLKDTGYRIMDTGYRILDTGYWIQDTGYRIKDTGYRIQDTGYWIQDTGYWI